MFLEVAVILFETDGAGFLGGGVISRRHRAAGATLAWIGHTIGRLRLAHVPRFRWIRQLECVDRPVDVVHVPQQLVVLLQFDNKNVLIMKCILKFSKTFCDINQ